MAKVEVFECEHCKKLYRSEDEYLKCLKTHSDEYSKKVVIDCGEEKIEIEYSFTKLSDIKASNGQITLAIYQNDYCDSFVVLDDDKIDELIKVLEDFKMAYFTEIMIRKILRGDV